MTINGKEYKLDFDNRALFDWGALCGFETYNETLAVFQDFAKVADGAKLGIDLADKLGKLCFVSLSLGNANLELTERDVFNHMINDPSLMVEALSLAILALPKPHPEDTAITDKGEKKK